MKEKQNYTRRFLGKIDGFSNKEEKAFEKKHLRAYLKGHTRFISGYKRLAGVLRVPIYSEVKQRLTLYEGGDKDV